MARARYFVGAATLAALATSIPALAHHSFAAEYDAAKPITLTGTIDRMEWTNPHAWLYVSVKTEGEAAVWAVELGSPNALLRQGWRRDSLNPGDVVTIAGHLARNGAPLVNARTVSLASGRTIFSRS